VFSNALIISSNSSSILPIW